MYATGVPLTLHAGPMPTITLNISQDVLDAAMRGEPFTLTGTLRAKKPKADKALSDTDRARQAALVDAWHAVDPAMNAGRLWKAFRAGDATPLDLHEGVTFALDWNEGRSYAPEWCAKELGEWLARVSLANADAWLGEDARTAYRARLGLGA